MPTEKLNCSLVYRRRYNNQSIAFVRPQGWRHYPKSKISAIFKVLTELFSIAQFFIIHLTLPPKNFEAIFFPKIFHTYNMLSS